MYIRIDDRDDGTRLTLARPPRNELDRPLLEDLLAALNERAARPQPPALLISGEGRHFSTGYSVGAIPDEIFHHDPAVRASDPFEQVMTALTTYPAPVVVAAQGDAWGGAVELLACCDLRVMAAGARLGVPPVRLGLVYSHTGLRRLLRGFGSALTRELLLTGEPITAERAAAAGFLNRVVPRDEVQSTAAAYLGAIARGQPGALRATRRVLHLLEEVETLPADAVSEIAALRHASRQGEEFRRARDAFLRGGPADTAAEP